MWGLGATQARGDIPSIEISGALYTYDETPTGVDVFPISDAQVAIYYDDQDGNPDNDLLVADADLGVGEQSQLVGSDGTYAFTVVPGQYRLEVIPNDLLLAFPSQKFPARSDSNVADGYGEAFEGGEVVSHDINDVLTTQRYYLRFDVDDSASPVLNNFIPLDPVNERVSIQTSASLKSASVGDIITYRISVQNRSLGGITMDDGGVEVVTELPQGIEMVEGSYGIFEVITANGSPVFTRISGIPEPSGSFLRFGAFPLNAAGQYEIRFNTRVQANAALGAQLTKSFMRTIADQTPLTDTVGVAVMLVPDTLLTTSTVLGRVFCDANSNQAQDGEEEGIGGVSVYLDNGSRVVTDASGFFHFSRVAAGSHLAKLDDTTLPPGSLSAHGGRAAFYLSPGLPGQLAFPVQCLSNWAKSDIIELNESVYRPPGTPPRRSRDIQVKGKLSPFELSLDNKEEGVGYVNLSITSEGGAAKGKKKGPNLQGLIDGELPAPLLFRTTFKKTDVLTWQLTILDLTDKPENLQTADALYFFAGQGRPSLYLLWDGKDGVSQKQLLKEGRRYGATMTFVTVEGHQLRSPIRTFGVKWRDPKEKPKIPDGVPWGEVTLQSLDAIEGPLFDAESEPTERTKTFIQEMATAVKPGYKMAIEVHGFDEDEITAMNNSRIQADNAREIALEKGLERPQIEAVGKGIDDTLVMHMGLRNRQQNHRIVILVTKPPIPPLEPVKPLRWPELVSLHGQPADIDKKAHTFDQTMQAEVGQPMILRMRASDGRYLQTIRVVQDKEIWAPKKPEKKVRKEKLTVYWPTARARLGEGYFDITHAPVTLKAERFAEEGLASIEKLNETEVSLGFRIRRAGALPWARWKIEVFEASKDAGAALDKRAVDDGFKKVHQVRGLGAPPEAYRLTGVIPNDEEPNVPKTWMVSPEKVYRLRISAETIYGDKLVSNPFNAALRDVDPDLTAEQADTETVSDAFNEDSKELNAPLLKRLDALAAEMKDDETQLRIEIHTNDNADETADQATSDQVGRAIATILKEKGISTDRLQLEAKGARELVDPGFSAFGAAKNRRVVFQVLASADAFSEMPQLVKLKIAGKAGRVDGPEFSTDVKIIENRPIKLELGFETGGQATLWLYPEIPEVFSGVPSAYADRLQTLLSDWRQQEKSLPSAKKSQPKAEGTEKADKGAQADKKEKGDTKPTPPSEPAPEASGEALLDPSSFDEMDEAIPYRGEGTPPLWWPTRREVPAAKMELWLPEDSQETIEADSFWVKGKAEPGTRVMVQGKAIPVHAESGHFQRLVEFQSDTDFLTVEGVDWMGNKVTWRKPVKYQESKLFALVMAEAAVGSGGTPLLELSDVNHFDSPEVLVYGRTAAWLRGRFKGGALFSQYDLDLHLDSARWDQDVFAPYMLNLDASFPTFGDDALETFVPNARYPLYLRLKADESHLHVGNMKTNLQQGSYFKYDHPRYGMKMRFNKDWQNEDVAQKNKWRTDTEVLVAGGDPYQQFTRNEFRGAGTSLYFLRHTQLMEGSEVVTLVVRDRISGNIKTRIPQVRDRDYTIQYAEGHIIFKQPVMAFVSTDMMLSQQLASVSHGDPVFVEVGYGYLSQEAFTGLTAGGRFTQHLGGSLDVGLGYLQEGRETDVSDYSLGEALVRWRPTQNSELELEYAFSTGIDNEKWLSQDGGLTWQAMGQQPTDGATQIAQIIYPHERSGSAYRLNLQTKLGHLFNRAPEDFLVSTWFRRVSLGFFSQDTVMAQGQTTWGLETRGALTDKDGLRLRYDGIINEMPIVPQATAARALHRELVTVAYDRKVLDNLMLQATYGYGYIWDEGNFPELTLEEPASWTQHLLGAGLIWHPIQKLGLFARQEYYAGDYPVALQSDAERLVTHFGADYQLTSALSIGIMESVRFDGENHLSLRANYAMTDSSQLYAQQRFGYVQDGWLQTSVVGAQQLIGQNTRTFAEYQIQNTQFGNAHQGVAGLSSQFKLPLGFHLGASYEWINRLGASNVVNQAQGYTVPGALTDGMFFAAPSVNGGGDFLYGAMSRDAISLNLFYQDKWPVVASQRLEWRYDQFDELRGGFTRQWWMSNSAAKWKIIPDLELFGRYNLATAENITAGDQEMYLEEGSFGLAYRPKAHNKYRVLTKYSSRVLSHPSGEDEFAGAYLSQALSLEPVIQLPFDLQWADKLALKSVQVQLPGFDEAVSSYVLSVNRLNWQLLRTLKRFTAFDMPGDINLGIEYRMLLGLGNEGLEEGWLTELQYAPMDFFTLGLGYNFTTFSDDVLDPGINDHSGFYFRAVGYY